jgi:hypothetical protein
MKTLISKLEKKTASLAEKEAEQAEVVRLAKTEYDVAKAEYDAMRNQYKEPLNITGSYMFILDRVSELKRNKTRVLEPLSNALYKARVKLSKNVEIHDKLITKNTRTLNVIRYNIAEKEKWLAELKFVNLMPLKALDKLPEDMVYYEIGEFLTYDNQIKLLVAKYNPIKLLCKISGPALTQLYRTIITEKDYFVGLSIIQAQTHIDKQAKQWRSYQTVLSLRQDIVDIFNRYKNDNAKALYKWFRRLIILIKPDKMYYTTNSNVRPLTEVPH